MSVLKLGAETRVIDFDPIASDAEMESDGGERRVERSLCCHAPVSVMIRRRETRIDPAEVDTLCRFCGCWCDTAEFIRNPFDGTLTDPETGDSGIVEGRDRSDDL